MSSYELHPSRYEQLLRQLGERLAAPFRTELTAVAAESSALDERIVQAIWHEQLLDPERLSTLSGKRVRVLDPGNWNAEAGPDFLMAEIELDGKRMRGDVEIHVHSSEWVRHQHDRDFAYGQVVLHAFLERTDELSFDTLQTGGRIERLELGAYLSPDLDSICRALNVEDYACAGRFSTGRCASVLAGVDPGLLGEFFDSAARQRMETKVARLAAQARGESCDQVLYQALMAAMGYKGGKTLFFLLAKRTPLEELKAYLSNVCEAELPLALEALLMHVANLVPLSSYLQQGEGGVQSDLLGAPDKVCGAALLDEETQAYLNQLHRWWGELAGYFHDRLIPPTRRWFAGVRPVNFATRRIAGMARLLARFEMRKGLLAGVRRPFGLAMQRAPFTPRQWHREIEALIKLFVVEDNSYWSTRFTLGGKRSVQALQLIGKERAASVVVNAVVPMLLLDARQGCDAAFEEFVWQLYGHFPALNQNAVTRFMSHRLFGPTPPEWLDTRREATNQALFHIFHDCCNNSALSCEECRFFKGLHIAQTQ